MKKAIFLDRDGTINEDLGYIHKIKDFKLIPGVIEALTILKDKNFIFIIITNQSGVGRGYFTISDVKIFNNHMLSELKKYNIIIEKIFVCPHKPESMCNCRKPSTKFINEAKKEFDINLKESYFIGDHTKDIQTGKLAGMKSILVLTGHGKKHKEGIKDLNPEHVANNLLEAAEWIINEN